MVSRTDLVGLEAFVEELHGRCAKFIESQLHEKMPRHTLEIMNSREYSAVLGRFRAAGIGIPSIYHQAQAVTVATSPSLILFDLQKVVKEATGERPHHSFVLFLVLVLMEELFHVLHFDWDHEKVRLAAVEFTEKFLDCNVPKDLLDRASKEI